MLLNLICPWHYLHRGTETGAACLSCHLKLQTQPGNGGGPCQAPFCSPAPKMRTSADSWQAEGASLESCCSASPDNGTARTEAQRLGLLACLATSNVKRCLGMGLVPARLPPAALLRKCERLQIAGRQKGLAWKVVAQPHLPMALLAQRHRDWGCLLVLPPQTSNVCLEIAGGAMPVSFRSPAPKMRTSADSWQAEGASLKSCCRASSAHGTARTEAQRLRLLAFLATSNFKRSLGMWLVPARHPPAALLRKCECLQITGRQKGLA